MCACFGMFNTVQKKKAALCQKISRHVNVMKEKAKWLSCFYQTFKTYSSPIFSLLLNWLQAGCSEI